MSTDLRSIAVPGLPPKKRGTLKGLEKEENDEYMVEVDPSRPNSVTVYLP